MSVVSVKAVKLHSLKVCITNSVISIYGWLVFSKKVLKANLELDSQTRKLLIIYLYTS